MSQELKVTFVKSFDKVFEGKSVTSALYFITGGNPALIEKYAEIQKRELNTASGLYPYYSPTFFGYESTIEYVNNEKYNNFYPNRSYAKAVATIKQQAFVTGTNPDSALVALAKRSGTPYVYPTAPAVDAPVVAEDATGDEF